MKINPKIINHLNHLDLNENEIKCYLSLLETGPSTVLKVSIKTNMKRSTCHHYIMSLINKGLVYITKEETRRMFVAEEPTKLNLLLQAKKYKFNCLENKLKEVINQLVIYSKN